MLTLDGTLSCGQLALQANYIYKFFISVSKLAILIYFSLHALLFLSLFNLSVFLNLFDSLHQIRRFPPAYP